MVDCVALSQTQNVANSAGAPTIHRNGGGESQRRERRVGFEPRYSHAEQDLHWLPERTHRPTLQYGVAGGTPQTIL